MTEMSLLEYPVFRVWKNCRNYLTNDAIAKQHIGQLCHKLFITSKFVVSLEAPEADK